MAVDFKCFLQIFYSGKPCENQAITQCLVYYDRYRINACSHCVKHFSDNSNEKFLDLKIKPAFDSEEEARIYKDALKNYEFVLNNTMESVDTNVSKSQKDEIFHKSHQDLKTMKEKYKMNFEIRYYLGMTCRDTVPFNWIGDRSLFERR